MAAFISVLAMTTEYGVKVTTVGVFMPDWIPCADVLTNDTVPAKLSWFSMP